MIKINATDCKTIEDFSKLIESLHEEDISIDNFIFEVTKELLEIFLEGMNDISKRKAIIDSMSGCSLYGAKTIVVDRIDKDVIRDIVYKIKSYMIEQHTQPNDVNREFARGWVGAAREIKYFLAKELGL